MVGSAGLLRCFGRWEDRRCDGFKVLVQATPFSMSGRRSPASVVIVGSSVGRRLRQPEEDLYHRRAQ